MSSKKQIIRDVLAKNAVVVMFLFIVGIAIPFSKYSGLFLVQEIIKRLGRDSFLVIALLLPVMAGMGINFGLAMGAMGSQVALILVTDWNITGALGILVAALIATPINIILGYAGGAILNRARGREMITSYILGFFMSGGVPVDIIILYGHYNPRRKPGIGSVERVRHKERYSTARY